MDVSTYYITTLTKAFTKIGPIVAFLLAGYFIFIKLPFLFFLRNMRDNKVKFDVTPKKPEKDYTLEDYKDFQRRMKTISAPKPEKQEEKKQEKKQERKEEPKTEKKQDQKQEVRKPSPKIDSSAEEIFELKPGQSFTQSELKKKYLELLKQNHPDKVAQMGPDFKKLAEKKTKDINQAYAKLKAKAAA